LSDSFIPLLSKYFLWYFVSSGRDHSLYTCRKLFNITHFINTVSKLEGTKYSLIYSFTNNDESGMGLWFTASAPEGEDNYMSVWRKIRPQYHFSTRYPNVDRSKFCNRPRWWKLSVLNLFMNSVLIPYSLSCKVLEISHMAKLNKIAPTMWRSGKKILIDRILPSLFTLSRQDRFQEIFGLLHGGDLTLVTVRFILYKICIRYDKNYGDHFIRRHSHWNRGFYSWPRYLCLCAFCGVVP
jgi:hypothetical protein